MTHAIPLKVTLRLVVYEQDKSAKHRAVKDIKEQEVYLGELPLMTEKGTFIINGTERVVVSQLQRSAGVFFDDDRGKTLASGKKIFSARIIPYRGSWVEFEFDANDILQVRIDRRRKMLATAFLRAFCFLEKGTVLSDEEILGAFYDLEEVVGFEDGAAVVKLNPEIHRHETPVAEDIKPPRHREAIVQAGRRLNKGRVERMVEAGITKFPVPMAWLENRRTGGRVVDSKTGEVLLEANQLLTSNELAKITARPVAPFKVIFEDPDKNDASVHETLTRDTHRNPDEALVEMYRRLRPGDPPTVESARALFRGMFLDARRYDLARVGRFMLNKKLGTESPLNWKTLRTDDIVAVVRRLLAVKQERYATDDIDHLGNRRVRSVGELLENQFRVGLTRMERAIKERMSIADIESLMPHDLVNAKPVSAVVKEFFGSSQLSQFMDQTNPLAELTHKRRLSALGPRGLSRERAGLRGAGRPPDALRADLPDRDAGRPEHRARSRRSRRTRGSTSSGSSRRRTGASRPAPSPTTSSSSPRSRRSRSSSPRRTPRSTSAGKFVADRVEARKSGEFKLVPPEEVQYMDVSPKQLVSVAASLIPFLENDDANRALMGSNMQRQAVPLLQPEAPLVGTGHGARGGPGLPGGGARPGGAA